MPRSLQPLSAISYQPLDAAREIAALKQDSIQIRNAVLLLEQDRESLQRGIRKLKVSYYFVITMS